MMQPNCELRNVGTLPEHSSAYCERRQPSGEQSRITVVIGYHFKDDLDGWMLQRDLDVVEVVSVSHQMAGATRRALRHGTSPSMSAARFPMRSKCQI